MDLLNWYMDFSKLLHGFVKIDTRISLGCYMDFSKLIQGFLLETGHATKSEKFKKNYIADFGPS